MQLSSSSQKSDSHPFRGIYSDVQRTTRIFNWFIVLVTLALFAGIFIVMSTNSVFAATVTGLSILPTLASLYFVRREKFETAAILLALVLITSITLVATRGLGIHHISVLGYPAILIIASLVTRTRTMIVITVYNLLCVVWLVFGELSGAYTPGVLVQSVPGDFFSVALILIITAAMSRFIVREMFQSSAQLQNELGERKRTEEKYRIIIENSLDGIFQSTVAGRFLSVNAAMVRIYGYDSADEMINSITDISSQIYVNPDDRGKLQQRLAAGEKVIGFESLNYRKDGSTFWASTNAQVIRDEKGNILYYEGTVDDITFHKNADEAIRSSEERYRTLFNGILEGIYRSTPAGRFVDVNPAMAIMFGYDSREQMLQADIKNDLFFAPEDRRSDYLPPGEERVDTFRMKRMDGSEIWVEDHGHYVYDEQGNIIFHEGLLRDVTPHIIAESDRKEAEAQIQKLNAELNERIEELEAKNTELTQFTYTVSHDLKSPLVTISGFLGFLEQDAESGNLQRLKKDTIRIREAVNKMHSLLTELLELSRIGRMMNAPEDVPFGDIVKEAVDIVQGRLEARGVAVHSHPNLPVVHGDRQRLIEVLQNLIDNAAKYMGDQTEPQIEIGQRGAEGENLIFFVRDNGMGIAPEYHERIFGLFNKLDSTSEGTGIGLALVRKIIEVHGGRIWVGSEPGRGSTFHFTLPAASAR